MDDEHVDLDRREISRLLSTGGTGLLGGVPGVGPARVPGVGSSLLEGKVAVHEASCEGVVNREKADLPPQRRLPRAYFLML